MTTTETTTVCPQCGFDWTVPDDAALDIVANAPSRYGRAFGGREGPRYGAGGTWSPREYLWHVVDGLRHAAEDLWMLAVDPDAGFTLWRQHDFMSARSPSPMSIRVGLWALAVAAGEWVRAAQEAPPDVSSWHPERVGLPGVGAPLERARDRPPRDGRPLRPVPVVLSKAMIMHSAQSAGAVDDEGAAAAAADRRGRGRHEVVPEDAGSRTWPGTVTSRVVSGRRTRRPPRPSVRSWARVG